MSGRVLPGYTPSSALNTAPHCSWASNTPNLLRRPHLFAPLPSIFLAAFFFLWCLTSTTVYSGEQHNVPLFGISVFSSASRRLPGKDEFFFPAQVFFFSVSFLSMSTSHSLRRLPLSQKGCPCAHSMLGQPSESSAPTHVKWVTCINPSSPRFHLKSTGASLPSLQTIMSHFRFIFARSPFSNKAPHYVNVLHLFSGRGGAGGGGRY